MKLNDQNAGDGVKSKSSDSDVSDDDDNICELPDPNKVADAKEKNPMMFVSGFDGDDDGIVPPAKPG